MSRTISFHKSIGDEIQNCSQGNIIEKGTALNHLYISPRRLWFPGVIYCSCVCIKAVRALFFVHMGTIKCGNQTISYQEFNPKSTEDNNGAQFDGFLHVFHFNVS